jgi:hypothetical protein
MTGGGLAPLFAYEFGKLRPGLRQDACFLTFIRVLMTVCHLEVRKLVVSEGEAKHVLGDISIMPVGAD